VARRGEEDKTVEIDADDGSPMRMRACQIESSLSLKDLGDDSLSVFDLCSESIWSLCVVAA